MNRWCFWVLAAATVATGCAIPLDEDVGDQTGPLIDGYPARDFDSVVFLMSETGACSGSIIAPRVVLTARHCVANASGDGVMDPTGITANVGPTFWEVEEEYEVVEIRTAEGRWDWDEELAEETYLTSFRMTDIALLILAERATPEPLPIDFGPLDPLVAHRVDVIGYGRAPVDVAGIRRRAQAWVLENIGDRGVQTDGVSCQGDSGGALMDEAGSVRAVVSGGLACDRERTNASWFVGLPHFRDLVEQTIADAEGCGPADMGDDCIVEEPEMPIDEPPTEPMAMDAGRARSGCSAAAATDPGPFTLGLWGFGVAGIAVAARRRRAA